MIKNEHNVVPPPLQVFKILRDPYGNHESKVESEQQRELMQIKEQIENLTRFKLDENCTINLENGEVYGTRINYGLSSDDELNDDEQKDSSNVI